MEKNAFTRIPKGHGFIYVHCNQLYKQVKKHGDVIYLKCVIDICDGSAKIQHGCFTVGVSILSLIMQIVNSNVLSETDCLTRVDPIVLIGKSGHSTQMYYLT